MTTIGFIGLGTMGLPMAKNLLKRGFSLYVYNRTSSKAMEMLDLGARIALTPGEAAKHADVLITMVANDEALTEVYYGSGGVMEAARPGLVAIDCSTVSPELSQRLYHELLQYEVSFLDAPVTGSLPGAQNGTLTFMVGGDEEALETARPVLEAMGSRIAHMGPSGAGSYMKLANNTLVSQHIVAMCEGLALAAKAGIKPETFFEVIGSGAANSRQVELKSPKVLSRDFSAQFSLALMTKDIRLASTAGQDLHVPMPGLDNAKALFQMAIARGLGDDDLSGLAKLYEEWIGVSVSGGAGANASMEAGALAGGDVDAGHAAPGEDSSAPAAAKGSERRKSIRVPMDFTVHVSVYQWEQEGSFKGQQIEARLTDLSNHGLQIATRYPLHKDMFVVFHFPQEADIPPITGKIIRIEQNVGEYRYGCLMSGVPPYVRLKLEEYIQMKVMEQDAEIGQV